MYFYILQLRVRVADSQHFEWLHLTWPLVPVQEHPPPPNLHRRTPIPSTTF